MLPKSLLYLGYVVLLASQLCYPNDQLGGSTMTLKVKVEYLKAIRERYYKSSKKQKSLILDELCATTGFARKYAIKIMAVKHKEGKKLSGRTRTYSKEALFHLQKLDPILPLLPW